MVAITSSFEWSNHPILSKLYSKSDLDGDSAYTIDYPSDVERQFLLNLTLQYREPGKDWEDASFDLSATFLDASRMAWYHPPFYHPLFEVTSELRGKHTPTWRAVVPDPVKP